MELFADILFLSVALISYYFARKNSLIAVAQNAIAYAEEKYADATNAGGKKFECAIDFIYKTIPEPIRFIFPREMIAEIVQNTFDRIEEYALLQLKKADQKIDNIIEEKVEN